MNENLKNYLQFLNDLDSNLGKRTERFGFLFLLFFLPSFVFIGLILLHTRFVGIKSEDKALITFYLPLACLNTLLSFFMTSLILASPNIHSFWLIMPFLYIVPVAIVYDCYLAITKNEVITKSLIVLPTHIMKSRQSVL